MLPFRWLVQGHHQWWHMPSLPPKEGDQSLCTVVGQIYQLPHTLRLDLWMASSAHHCSSRKVRSLAPLMVQMFPVLPEILGTPPPIVPCPPHKPLCRLQQCQTPETVYQMREVWGLRVCCLVSLQIDVQLPNHCHISDIKLWLSSTALQHHCAVQWLAVPFAHSQ